MEEKKSGNSSGENTSNVRMPRRGKKLSPPLGQLKANNFYTGMAFNLVEKLFSFLVIRGIQQVFSVNYLFGMKVG